MALRLCLRAPHGRSLLAGVTRSREANSPPLGESGVNTPVWRWRSGRRVLQVEGSESWGGCWEALPCQLPTSRPALQLGCHFREPLGYLVKPSS